jgi:hypothetical protein
MAVAVVLSLFWKKFQGSVKAAALAKGAGDFRV